MKIHLTTDEHSIMLSPEQELSKRGEVGAQSIDRAVQTSRHTQFGLNMHFWIRVEIFREKKNNIFI